ncbi:FlgO family outer membrane protein [Glaciecola sp. 2405UD65-10]|uniref:FlgO family outer membrane protein n=1 Tax=Glaciecola sp. 2405UD65-10 TaxID=3397244 RepID=UPI003B5C3098
MKILTSLSIIVLLSGCSSLPSIEQLFAADDEGEQGLELNEVERAVQSDESNVADATNQYDSKVDAFGSMNKPAMMSKSSGAYKAMPLTKHVGDYVRNMAQDLVANMEYVTERTPVAVTHFSLIDSDLKATNLLGQQMAESFVHEFHKFRMPVVEFKSTQYITVTESGDFVLSRDFLDLKNATPIQYVLTGTMTKHQGGYLVNARMLGMQSNVVVASAQSFIPYYIADALLPSGSSKQNEIVDGVRLIQGD